MRSWKYNDPFKICIAKLRENNSKYFICDHGGGLTGKFTSVYNYTKEISSRVVYDTTIKKKNHYKLSPTLPIISRFKKNSKKGRCFNIALLEGSKFLDKLTSTAKAEESIEEIKDLVSLIKNLPSEIKENLNLRVKNSNGMSTKNFFLKLLDKRNVNDNDKISFYDFIENSKLILVNYPQTAYSEIMYANKPSLLICKKDFWLFSNESLKMFNTLKKNKMAFESFSSARNHIVKSWPKIDYWWNSQNIQTTRKLYLKKFFNVKKNWFQEWSDFLGKQKKQIL